MGGIRESWTWEPVQLVQDSAFPRSIERTVEKPLGLGRGLLSEHDGVGWDEAR